MQTLDLNDMLASIDCNNKPYRDLFSTILRSLPQLDIENGPWLAGGSVRRLFDGSQEEADFDIFFKNEKQLEEFKNKFIDNETSIIHEENDHSINIMLPVIGRILDGVFRNSPFAGPSVARIQLIKIYHPDVDTLLDSFDYTLCQFATDGDCLVTGGTSLRDITSKRCMPNKITYPKSSMRRMLKYAKQGYTIDDTTFEAILKTASNGEILEKEISVGVLNNAFGQVINNVQFNLPNGPAISGYFDFQQNLANATAAFQGFSITAETFNERVADTLRDCFQAPRIDPKHEQ